MKSLYLCALFTFLFIGNVLAQADTIKIKDIPNYIGKTVTISVQAAHFDITDQYTYLYFGGRYPESPLTIMVKHSVNNPIKLSIDIILGRDIVYFTGTLQVYNGRPDTSLITIPKKIKKEMDKNKVMYIGDKPYKGHLSEPPHTYSIDLTGKPVILITDQHQIGKKTTPARYHLY